jgi:hypothetical protein
MSDARTPSRHAAADEGPAQLLRQLGSRAHQLRATTRAADHFSAQDAPADRNTGSWLMSCALAIAGELAAEIDALARRLKEQPAELAFKQRVSLLRIRAHQVHAAARAADHYLDLDTPEDHDTGSWLIATACNLAQQLACEIDDGMATVRRPATETGPVEAHDPALARRVAAAANPVRGAA